MRWGLIARAEDRGLGNLTWAVHRHLGPDRTVVVDMGELAKGFAPHLDRYPGATVVPFVGGTLDEDTMRGWLDGLDVVLSAETFYDWRVVDWARELGVATVCYSMPEFHLHHGAHGLHTPTRFWNPTCWRHDQMPPGTVVVPLPVDLDAFAHARDCNRQVDGPLRVLHVAGHRAAHDRNGTSVVLVAARRLSEPIRLTIHGQDGRLPRTTSAKEIEVVYRPQSVADYEELYEGHDVLVMPRRFGGLSMPVQEAMAARMAVVMSDCPPNPETWPIVPVRARRAGAFRAGGGSIDLYEVPPSMVTRKLDELARDWDALDEAKLASWEWAQAHSWDALRHTWLAELASAALAERREARAR